jgi:RimJ/RimL family protein N-acetyltransferase
MLSLRRCKPRSAWNVADRTVNRASPSAVCGGQPVLATARLLLRRPCEADIPALVELANDLEVARTLSRLPHPYDATHARFFLEKVLPREFVWAITLRAEGTFIGVIGLTPDPEAKSAELGYWLGRRFWGRGFATEAGIAVVEHAFKALRLAKLTAGYMTDNRPSGRVLEKLGFVKTGEGERPCAARGETVRAIEMERLPI